MKHTLNALLMAGALMLAACGSGGDNSAIRDLAGAGAQPTPAPTATPAPLPTDTPAPPAQVVQQVEVTRIVEATVEVQIIVTATPDIAGFQIVAAIDESAQPCPARFWNHKRHRCMATDAQIEQAAREVQP